jgi:hypothetical protein
MHQAVFFTSLGREQNASMASNPPPSEVQPFVRWTLDRLSAETDSALRAYEARCFREFQTSTTTDAKGHWLHALAAAIVEMSNRGLSLNGVHQ